MENKGELEFHMFLSDAPPILKAFEWRLASPPSPKTVLTFEIQVGY